MAFLPALGAVAAVAGPILGGISQAKAASYQAKVASNNARIAQQNAAHAAQVTSVRTEQEGLKAAQRLSSVEAGIAANNIETGTGSAAAVQESQHALGMQDVATVGNEGALKAYGYSTEAANFNAQAAASRAEVVPDIVGGVLKGVGSLAGNAGALGIGPTAGAGAAGAAEVAAPSLAEGAPSIPKNYEWMRSGYDYNLDHDNEFGY